ncbi:unnamed protein product [Caenorhabditis bovis]|uniref:G-protein coupled receptors family 1 profile domain-containing protein n=1 Tax=Caenorhabditis bovis TaxID=2654633 RepID=A0A8S1E5F7_9PELO|nr:unnamed protein product [Caenorhabditis bovis]
MEWSSFGFFLIPSALIGVVCNWTVVFSVLKISSLKQSFGYLTANQALGDAIHCTAFLFYVCPMMILDIEEFQYHSKHCGFLLLFCYELSVLSHLVISFNRFSAVYTPTRYSTMFKSLSEPRNTVTIIVVMWVSTTILTIYFYQVLCPISYDPNMLMFSLRFSDFCATLTWYTDFWKFIICITLVVVFDIFTVVKVHSINKLVRGVNDTKTNAKKRSREMVFLRQTCLQGIAFVFELVSYFVVPLFLAENKVLLFFLTTFAWVSVHALDGAITVACNPDLRKFITFRGARSSNVVSSTHAHPQMTGERRSETQRASTSETSHQHAEYENGTMFIMTIFQITAFIKNGEQRMLAFYLYHPLPSIISAFAYKDHIAVTLFSQTHYGRVVYCRYFDCQRNEIKQPFEAFVFPESAVLCGRRIGAEYLAVSNEPDGELPENPVKIIRRDEPEHFFTVCLAPLYGDEAKYLQLAEFIEYYKLQGATFFHIYHINVSDYDRLLLDDYVRTGEIETIKMHDNFWRADFMWHMVQINDCHFRSKTFAKWTAFIDIDERLEMRQQSQFRTIGQYLDSITDPKINYLFWKTQWVQKTEDDPPRYINESHLIENMGFRKFKMTSEKIGGFSLQPKCIIRPEMTAVMFVHWPTATYPGGSRLEIDENVGINRHYRSLKKRILNYFGIDRISEYGPYKETSMAPWIEEKLTNEVSDRIQWVYDVKDLECRKKQIAYYRHDYTRYRRHIFFYIVTFCVGIFLFFNYFEIQVRKDNESLVKLISKPVLREYVNPVAPLDDTGYIFSNKPIPPLDPRFEMINNLPTCDLTQDRIPMTNNATAVMDAFQACMRPLIEQYRGKPAELMSNWVKATKPCDDIPEIKNLRIDAFNNQHETKWTILPNCKEENTMVTLGIGHDTEAEERLNRTLPNTKFFGADPMIDPNMQLYSAFGKFFPFAIGRKAGLSRFRVLPNQSQRTRKYTWQDVTTVDLVYFLHNILSLQRIDISYIDIEGGEFEFLDHFHKSGPLDEKGIHVCQFNLEVHTAFNPPGEQIFHDFIFRALEERRWVFVKPMLTGKGVHRMFLINMENQECVRKFIQ